ncbi:unnamed protein product [Dicrocoelium dendriticum]|nr:unnamed protein product [Dicrocoelium dendriticum]
MLAETCDLHNGGSPLLDDELSKSVTLEESTGMPVNCSLCEKPFNDPVILSCLHIFDRECLRPLERNDNVAPYIKCPRCGAISGGLKTLPPYDSALAAAEKGAVSNAPDTAVQCSVCTDGNEALYRCLHCAGTLCERCRDVHKVMKVFSHHEILVLTEEEKRNSEVLQRNMQNAKPVSCPSHPEFMYTTFCMQCHVPLCDACFECDHKTHITSALKLVPEHVDSLIFSAAATCSVHQKNLRELTENLHSVLSDLSASRDKNKSLITDTFNQWKVAIERVKDYFLQRNRELHDDLEMRIWSRIHAVGKTIDHIDFACEFSKSYLKKCSNIEMCKLTKNVLTCFDRLSKTPLSNEGSLRVNFTPTPCVIHELVKQNFGTFDGPPSATPVVPKRESGYLPFSSAGSQFVISTACDVTDDLKRLSLKLDGCLTNGAITPLDASASGPLIPLSSVDAYASSRAANLAAVHLPSSIDSSTDTFTAQSNEPTAINRPITNWSDLAMGMVGLDQTEFLNSAQGDHPFLTSPFINPEFNQNTLRSLGNPSAMSALELESNMLKQKLPINYNATLYEYCRMRAARCSQMNLLTKWGSLGCELGRLNSPHGFCLGFEEEIVVADTYNHRIQIFTKRGDFVSFFGVSGRVDGLLWYPRKVAIIRQSQRYVVCDRGNERSRMQLFSRSGHFVRRIPIRYIDIVAGLAINQHGHIVAIDSVSPSVFVVSEEGDLIRWFDCSNHMREPSDVAIHGREYYICDFKAHCVIVFEEDGTFVRRIGGESITDFPNGIDVSDHGDVLVGDSHGNRFHIAVFSRTGELLSEFVCNQTKVSRSCCLKITTEGYVVTLARSSNNVLVLDTLYIC